MKSFVTAAALLVALITHVPAAHALCARAQIGDAFHTPEAKGAAVVITQENAGPATIDKPVFRVDGKDGAFDKIVLAPGLVAYRLPAGAKRGEIDGGAAGVAKVEALDPSTPALPAPKLTKLYMETNLGMRGSSELATATIDGEPPAGAIALVITDAKGKALTWGRVHTSSTLTVLARHRCGVLPDGTVAPTNGQRVKAFWVDEHGRASPASKAIKAIAKTNKYP